MSCCTSMMSARGFITSPTRRSRRPRMFLSIRLSSGEKPDSPGGTRSSTSLRSARIEPCFQPNSARKARMNQPSPLSRAGGTGTGRLRGSNEVEALSSGIGSGPLEIAREIGVGHVHGQHDTAFQAFHFIGLGVGLVIVADEMQKAMHREVGEVMQEIAVFVRAFARQR